MGAPFFWRGAPRAHTRITAVPRTTGSIGYIARFNDYDEPPGPTALGNMALFNAALGQVADWGDVAVMALRG